MGDKVKLYFLIVELRVVLTNNTWLAGLDIFRWAVDAS
jgi:hypothetical protein